MRAAWPRDGIIVYDHLKYSMSSLGSAPSRFASILDLIKSGLKRFAASQNRSSWAERGSWAQGYEGIFCIFLVALAFLFRDNPYLIYPQILYLLFLLLLLNLIAGKALDIGRFGKQLSAAVILANCGTIAAILSYSGEQASNLWVLFLLPIYTACILLDGREVAWVTIGAIAFNVVYYIFATFYWNSVTYFEISIKSAIFAFAAVTTWRVVLQERSSQSLLKRSSAELERTEH
jgi:hypothetical protein